MGQKDKRSPDAPSPAEDARMNRTSLTRSRTSVTNVSRTRKTKTQLRPAATGLPDDRAELRLRIRALEAQLDVSQRELAEAKRQSQEQFRSLQAERKDAEKQLAAKDQELETLLRQANQAQQRAHQSESALQEANSRIVRFSEELAERSAQFEQLRSHSTAEETSKGATSPREQSGLSSPGAVNDFYQQAVSTLTVILAAADLLAMNRRLDPSLQETAREIRAQGEKVLSLIKGITHPEETRRAEKGA